MALTFTLHSGKTWTDDETLTAAKLNQMFELGYVTADSGTIETSTIADRAVTLAKLTDVTRGSIIVGGSSNRPEELIAKNDTYMLLGNGSDLASVAMSGDATIANDGTITIGQVLDGSNIANVANDQATPGGTVLYVFACAGGSTTTEDITTDQKVRVIDVWAQHTGGDGETSDTLTVQSDGNDITDAMDWSGSDKAVVRASTIDDAYATVPSGSTLRVSMSDDDSGNDLGAGLVYVLAIPVA